MVTQIFLAKAQFGGKGVNSPQYRWLGWVLIIQAGTMILAAFITKVLVPNPCDIDGNSRSLEDLGRGKEARKAMEQAEKEARSLRNDPIQGSG